jgi:hypothetical protein
VATNANGHEEFGISKRFDPGTRLAIGEATWAVDADILVNPGNGLRPYQTGQRMCAATLINAFVGQTTGLSA